MGIPDETLRLDLTAPSARTLLVMATGMVDLGVDIFAEAFMIVVVAIRDLNSVVTVCWCSTDLWDGIMIDVLADAVSGVGPGIAIDVPA